MTASSSTSEQRARPPAAADCVALHSYISAPNFGLTATRSLPLTCTATLTVARTRLAVSSVSFSSFALHRYIEVGKAEGAKVLTGGSANDAVAGGYYVKPTILSGTNDMRVFQEEIFGPVTAATKRSIRSPSKAAGTDSSTWSSMATVPDRQSRPRPPALYSTRSAAQGMALRRSWGIGSPDATQTP